MSIRIHVSRADIDEAGRMVASLEKSGGDDDVYTVSVVGGGGVGYDNQGYDGELKPSSPKSAKKGALDEPKSKIKLTPGEKWRILKNIAAVSFSFMVQFTAFQGIANLQSSINAQDGLGTVSLSAVYAALVVSCIFVPTFLIKRLTVKWTLCFSMLCYAPYIGLQIYPKFYTLVPAGVLLGLGAAPMWAAKATYLTQAAAVYAKITDQPVDGIVVRFFGFFFLAWQTAELWGNLISSLVLGASAHGGGGHSVSLANDTLLEESLKHCGANFCFVAGSHGIERPPHGDIVTISLIYLACIFAAVIFIAILVDPLSRYGEKQRKGDSSELSGIQLLSATAYHLKKPYQQLLIPITVWIGMEQAFIGADFTQAYVSCALGVSNVGYVMICFGVVNAICSLVFGTLMKYVGRFPIMALGCMVHAGLVIIMLYWRPHPNSPLVFFGMSGLWGVGDAVWQTQVNGLYGTLFRRNKEAAFSNYRLWESAGFVVAYAYSTHLCARMKLYVMFFVLCVGFIGYIAVEILHKRKKMRMRRQAEVAAKAAESKTVQTPPPVEETDDEKDDIDDEVVVTHL